MTWVFSEQPGTGPQVAGAFKLSGDECPAWDTYAAAVLSNLTDRTMGADVAASFAATIADAMIMERRKRPHVAPPGMMPAPATVPGNGAALAGPPAVAATSGLSAPAAAPVASATGAAVAAPPALVNADAIEAAAASMSWPAH